MASAWHLLPLSLNTVAQTRAAHQVATPARGGVVTTINAAASFAVTGGPNLALNSAIAAQAYDKVDVAIAPGDDAKVVNLQPGAAAQLRLLVIKSSFYGSELTYAASDGSDDSDAVTLDGPQVFIGPGAMALFGV